METYLYISMYPDKAFIHAIIENAQGETFSMCEQITLERAKELAWKFNIQLS